MTASAQARMVRTAVGRIGQKRAGSPPVNEGMRLASPTGGAAGEAGADVGGAPGTVVGSVMTTAVTRVVDGPDPDNRWRAARASLKEAVLIFRNVLTKSPFSEKSTATMVGTRPR